MAGELENLISSLKKKEKKSSIDQSIDGLWCMDSSSSSSSWSINQSIIEQH